MLEPATSPITGHTVNTATTTFAEALATTIAYTHPHHTPHIIHPADTALDHSFHCNSTTQHKAKRNTIYRLQGPQAARFTRTITATDHTLATDARYLGPQLNALATPAAENQPRQVAARRAFFQPSNFWKRSDSKQFACNVCEAYVLPALMLGLVSVSRAANQISQPSVTLTQLLRKLAKGKAYIPPSQHTDNLPT